MGFLKIFFAVIFFSLLNISPSTAQDNYNLAPGSEFIVAGTSTIHDWTMESKEGTGKAVLALENGSLKKINSLVIEMPVKSLKSGKGQMDRNAYVALKSDKNPNIIFELTRVQEINKQQIVADGNLTVAGTTRPVTLKVNYKISDNTIQFTSTKDITFTEYKISPPTAVFGTIKTGDNLQLSIQTTFKQQSLIQ